MIKIRIEGIPKEADVATERLEENFTILSKSDHYKNRNGGYVRIYVDAEIKQNDK